MWRTILGSREGRIGVPLGAVMILVVAVGRFVAPYPPDKIGLAIPGSAPSREHPLGVDGLGRDVLSRLLTGGTSVLVTPLTAVSVSFILVAEAITRHVVRDAGEGQPIP
ncbi:MAG: hypothetical protein ABIZ05_10900 [Pseudonocardiaceae bacterium]